MLDGFHVPATFSLEVPGKAGAVEFWQTDAGTFGNVGKIPLVIVMFTVTGPAHEPDDGVNI